MQYKVLIPYVKGTRRLVEYNPEFYENTYKSLKNSKDELYESLYIYNNDHKKTLDATKSLAGIRDVLTDTVVFDFDNEDSPEKALADTKTVIQRLMGDGFTSDELNVFYSGNKGFHVKVDLNYTIDRSKFESIVEEYAGDLETFDTSVKDQQRVFRLPLSFNKKSGCYKIPLLPSEVLEDEFTIEDLKDFAKDQNFDSNFEILSKSKKTNKVFKIRKKKEEVKLKEVDYSTREYPDMSNKPSHLTEAKFALQEGFFDEGERNEACMILASTYKYLGYNKELTYNMIKATLRMRAARLGIDEYDKQELWRTCVEPVFSPTWKGGVYREDSGLLKKIINRYGLNKTQDASKSLTSLSDLGEVYRDFATNIEKNTIKLGVDELDAKVRITTSMLVSMVAAPGAGKTSSSLGFLNTTSKNGVKSIFFSLDMGVPLVYQKLIQKHTGESDKDIEKNYLEKNSEKIQQYQDIIQNEYSNVKFCFKSGLTCEMIREIILTEKEASGELPKFVVIDYLECIRSQFSDPTASKAFIATSLKDLANELGICILLLVQPAKVLANPAIEIVAQTAIKGSGVVIEASSVIMGIYRPGFDPKYPDDDRFITFVVLKNRMGQLSSTDLSWDGLTGHIRSLSLEEERDLIALRDAISREEVEKNQPKEFTKFGSDRNKDYY